MKKMFSGVFSSISLYIILGLAASTASLGWLSVHNYRAKVVAEQALAKAINVNTEMQKSLNLKDLSCKIDDGSTVEFMEEKEEVREKIDDLVVKITNLKRGIAITPSENETLKNAKNFTIYGPELLSLDLRLLLNQAYCIASPEDSVCGTTGQPSGDSVQGSSLR